MGTPALSNEPASGCPLCFGSGGVIGGVQPRYVTVTISNCRAGGAINQYGGHLANGIYRLEHVTSCAYRLTTAIAMVTLDWTIVRSRVWHIISGITPASFFSPVGVLCADFMEGNSFDFPVKASVDGEARVSWDLEGL